MVGATDGLWVGLTVAGLAVLGWRVGDEDVGADEIGRLLGFEVTGRIVGNAVCLMMH
jgi:hypothetical protein